MRNRTGRIVPVVDTVVPVVDTVETLDLLTLVERVAYETIPVARYGERGVATFRAYLLAQARRRTA